MVTHRSGQAWGEPEKLAELRLPPSFVYDHCIRTLSYQGAVTPADLAHHWRVSQDIAFEVIDVLKSAGLLDMDTGQSTFERGSKVRLSAGGQARVAAARARTWYAGALPVPVDALAERLRDSDARFISQPAMEAALAAFSFEPQAASELGQALAAGTAVSVIGLAPDEQPALTGALRAVLEGEASLPYAVFAAGAVIRLFDGHVHTPIEERHEDNDFDILRSRGVDSQWVRTLRPSVYLAGGVLASDVLPAFDEDARFYVAPTPLKACGGLFAAADCEAAPALADLVRLWLLPGRAGIGIVLLRSGERIEVPWRAATLLLSEKPLQLELTLSEAVLYQIDVSALAGDALRSALDRRLSRLGAEATLVDMMASRLEEHELGTRTAAWKSAQYLIDRAAYEGADFDFSADALMRAIGFASRDMPRFDRRRRAA